MTTNVSVGDVQLTIVSYWKHGDHGGNMFGVIHPAEGKADAKAKSAAPSGGNLPAEK